LFIARAVIVVQLELLDEGLNRDSVNGICCDALSAVRSLTLSLSREFHCA
jgi:hypothetical protein